MDRPESTTADLEAVERDAFADFWSAAPADLRARYGIAHRPVGDGVLLRASGIGGSMVFNRLLGYGITGAAEAETLDGVIAEFGGAGIEGWVLQVAPAAPGLAALAAERGLAPHPRAWVKFVRGPEPLAAGSALAIRPAGAADAPAFGESFCAAFGFAADLAPWIAALPERDRWRCFIAWEGRAPVGAGALFLGRGLGWLGFGGISPGHRGRGGQAALFAARIAAGRDAGCRGFVTETGAPLPGEPAPSFNNILRAGFRVAYHRPNLRRPPPAPSQGNET